jgi:peptide deformylase
MNIELLGSDFLRQKCEVVTKYDKEFRDTTAEMIELLRKKKGVGLAGPQVGLLQRFFVVAIEKQEPLVFVNPVIVGTSEEEVLFEEGCLSLPGVWADVKRPARVRVQARNERGKVFNLDADGILARVIQHEYDHLDGKLFFDYLSEVKRARLLTKYEHIRNKNQRSKGE